MSYDTYKYFIYKECCVAFINVDSCHTLLQNFSLKFFVN